MKMQPGKAQVQTYNPLYCKKNTFTSPCKDWVLVKVIVEKSTVNGKDCYYLNSFQELNPNNITDWRALIQLCYNRSLNIDDALYFKEFVWFLNWHYWKREHLQQVFTKLSPELQVFVKETIEKIGPYLNVYKQKAFKSVISEYRIAQNPLFSGLEAYSYTCDDAANVFDNFNSAFALLCRTEHFTEEKTNNPIIEYLHWLREDSYKVDYDGLKEVFSFLDNDLLLNVVRRYFFDVKEHKISFDGSFLKRVSISMESVAARVKLCIKSPEGVRDIAVPLLVDSILTCVDSKGENLTTYNGILDIEFKSADVLNPLVNCSLDKILPTCKGLTINQKFQGFVQYELVYEYDESGKSDEDFMSVACGILMHICKKEQYLYYVNDNQERVIIQNEETNIAEDRVKTGEYEDRWLYNNERDDETRILDSFLSVIPAKDSKGLVHISIDDIDLVKFRSCILSSISEQVPYEKGFIIKSGIPANLCEYLIPLFKKIKILVCPASCYISPEWDAFGLYGGNAAKIQLFNKEYHNDAEISLMSKETQVIKQKVIESIRKNFGKYDLIAHIDDKNNEYFDISYSQTALDELRAEYRINVYASKTNTGGRFFLSSIQNRFYAPKCAPKYEDKTDTLLDLPFFWCQGKMCYNNHLDKHLVANARRSEYTLFEMLEILGYPMVNKVRDCYEANPIVRSFIGLVNKAVRMFSHLRCRTCGHVLYPRPSNAENDFNDYKYFHCIDPLCSCFDTNHYISHCHSCSKGIIDSRDTVQCPNGWYICPECLSCCSDNSIESVINRYQIKKLSPQWIMRQRGNGHNNKSFYFCPQCGNRLQGTKYENSNDVYWVCYNCGFNQKL